MIEAKVTALTSRAGVRTVFRSRLEARWSLYFDELGFDWKYEPFKYPLNDKNFTYTPDFEVVGIGIIEIKPTWEALTESIDRIESYVRQTGNRVYLFSGSEPVFAGARVLYGHPLRVLTLDEMQRFLVLCGTQRHELAKADWHLVFDTVRSALKKASEKMEIEPLSVGEVMAYQDQRSVYAMPFDLRKDLLRKVAERHRSTTT